MSSTYEFLVFGDMKGMRGAKAKSQIRRHAMREIGALRRRPRPNSKTIELILRDSTSTTPGNTLAPYEKFIPMVDSRPLYNAHVRALSCKVDPFDSVAMPLDRTAHALLQYFVCYSCQTSNFTFTPDTTSVMDAAIRDGLMIRCILSAAASRIPYVQGVSPSRVREKALTCTQQSLRLLRLHLESNTTNPSACIDERLVDCILYLAAAALYRGDVQTTRLHVSAAVQLIRLGGGIERVRNPRILVRMLSLDDVLASSTLQPCMIECKYDPGPLAALESTLNHTEFSDRNSQVNEAQLGDLLPAYLRSLLLQIVECDRMKDTLGSISRRCTPHELQARHWLITRTLAIRNQLLAFATMDARIDALRMCMIIWTLLPPNDLRQSRTAEGLARALKSHLERTPASIWTGHKYCKLWCCFVGLLGAAIHCSCRIWFITVLHDMIRNAGDTLGTRKGNGLAGVIMTFQQTFLYREKICRPVSEALALTLKRD